jgi:prepilin-type processing-associated H-X9-DG protein
VKIESAIVVFLAVAVLAALMAAPDIAGALILGWLFFLGRVLPRISMDGAAIAVALAALLLFTTGIHWLGRQWHHRSSAQPESGTGWKVRWSLAVVASVFLLFAAGICLIGIVHQAGWILTDKQPLLGQKLKTFWDHGSKTKMRMLVYDMHNYYDSGTRHLPPGGSFDKDGTMLHSWETFIMPYIAYDTSPIDKKLPWNHPKNAPYFRCAIPQFLNADLGAGNLEDEEGFGLSHFAANCYVLGPNTQMRFEDITDGLSRTFLLGEVNANFKPWGHPANWRDPGKGINQSPYGFGGPRSTGGANMAMVDGSVHFISERVSPTVLQALATPNGGEKVDESVLLEPR